jgi:SAM-dependent methyltransferase
MLRWLERVVAARAGEEAARKLRTRLRRWRRPACVDGMRRLTPLSDEWGFDRGTPVDRYYIEDFLARNRKSIQGAVLEIRDASYTTRFGQGVTRSDVLDIDPANPRATLIADLTAADRIPSDRFDCFILTQTLQLIHDHGAAIRHAHRMLRPGGLLLVTVPSVSRIIPRYGLGQEHWRYTPASCQRLFGDVFGDDNVEVKSYGNVLAGIAALAGLAAEELSPRELDHCDPYFPVLIAVRAVKL